MSKRDIVLAELAELDKCNYLSPREDGWWLPRDLNNFRNSSLVKQAAIPGPEVSGCLTDLYNSGLVDRWPGQSDIYYQINGDGLKALEDNSSRHVCLTDEGWAACPPELCEAGDLLDSLNEEMVLRVAKWAYNKATDEIKSFDEGTLIQYWDDDESFLAKYEFLDDPRAEWIEGARKAIRGET